MLQPKDMLFFNKEGLPMNLTWDGTKWAGKVMFDPNGTDTYRTVGIYALERVAAMDETGECETVGVLVRNGLRFTRGGKTGAATSLALADASANSRTKRLSGEGLHAIFNVGDYVQLLGVGAPYAATTGGSVLLYQVIGLDRDALYIWAGGTNSTATPYSGAMQVVSHHVASATATSGDNISSVLLGDRVSVVGTARNDGTYTALSTPIAAPHKALSTRVDDLSWAANGQVSLSVTLNGPPRVAYAGKFSTATSGLIVTHDRVPPGLVVGSVVRLEGFSTTEYTVTAIPSTRRSFTVDVGVNPLAASSMAYRRVVFASNEMSFSQASVASPITGQHSAAHTVAALVAAASPALAQAGLALAWPNDINQPLTLAPIGHRADMYEATLSFTSTAGNRTVSATTVPSVYIAVSQAMEAEETHYVAGKYARDIVLEPSVPGGDAIDSLGLEIVVNGRRCWVAQDDDDVSTVADWISSYSDFCAGLGLAVTYNSGSKTISFVSDAAGAPVRLGLALGDSSGWRVPHSEATVRYVLGNSFSVLVNGRPYTSAGTGVVSTTLAAWVATNAAKLRDFGVVVSSAGSVLSFGTLDPEQAVQYTIFPAGAKLRVQDAVFVVAKRQDTVLGSALSCNKVTGLDFVAAGLSTGQVVTLTGAEPASMNRQYIVVGLDRTELTLSYQGPFWDWTGELRVTAGEFVREPRHGEVAGGTNPRMAFSWGETQTPDMFLFDFSGEQLRGQALYDAWAADGGGGAFKDYAAQYGTRDLLRPSEEAGAFYAGPRPLTSGGSDAHMNAEPNRDPELSESPMHQQTVFPELRFPLFYEDDPRDVTVAPEPLQVFAAYRALEEGTSSAQLTVSLEEDRVLQVTPAVYGPSSVDDELVFAADGTVTIEGASTASNFAAAGFATGQTVMLYGEDVTDARRRATFPNNGRSYRVLAVSAHAMRLDVSETPLLPCRSVVYMPPLLPPYVDGAGEAVLVARRLRITFRQAPTVLAVLDVLGQTEAEDERYKLALGNLGRGVQPKDVYLFKEHDVREAGVYWPLLNRKRKELLQVHREIYDYVSSYKAVSSAIEYFGYNDLGFHEYFVNLDLSSDRFGKLFTSELLDVLDRRTPGWRRKNPLAARLPDDRHKKTNLFSLTYRITDDEGNFVEGYSFDDVTTKLFGLQQWLEDNVVPIGSRIMDISGRAVGMAPHRADHHSFAARHVRASDVFCPAIARVSAARSPVQVQQVSGTTAVTETNTFSVRVMPHTQDHAWPDAVTLRVTTFNVQTWSAGALYGPGDEVLYGGLVWRYKAGMQRTIGQTPTDTTYWARAEDWRMLPVQQVQLSLYRAEPIVLVVNADVDPHFEVEITSANNYGGTWQEKRTYSVSYADWLP